MNTIHERYNFCLAIRLPHQPVFHCKEVSLRIGLIFPHTNFLWGSGALLFTRYFNVTLQPPHRRATYTQRCCLCRQNRYQTATKHCSGNNPSPENSFSPQTPPTLHLCKLGKQRCEKWWLQWDFDSWLLGVGHVNKLKTNQGKTVADVSIKRKKPSLEICLPSCLLSLSEDRRAAKHTSESRKWNTALIQPFAWILQWPRSQRLKVPQSLN